MEKYTVILDKKHTHEGKKRPVGDEITVSKLEAEFLFNQQVIKKIPAKANPKVTEDK